MISQNYRVTRATVAFTLLNEEVTMKKWECTVCGYVYDPAKGDPDANIPPGTPFEELPDDWVCPDCGSSKDMFEPLAG